MDFLEVSAKTVEDAITKACVDMGLSSDQLDIQVISEGSAGFLGLGSKPAVIQVRRKFEEVPEEAPAPEPAAKEEPVKEAEKPEKEAPKQPKPRNKKKPKDTAAGKAKEAPAEEPEIPEFVEKQEVIPERTSEEIVTMKASASQFLDSVFKAMNLPVDLTIEYEQETGSLNVNMEGEDMGILIGKHGQTLDSLQYLTNLVANKNTENRVHIVIDVENYRDRRAETLTRLAKRLADKVKKSGERIVLEPMNPHERKIIHTALQNDNKITTLSEGSEPFRKVVIELKK